ncbi:hypothetical protein CSW67_25750 [Shigella boydii]|nr:hypothetical protein CSW72_25695 [Shigella boydii]PHU90607.1 hypothetical protein CSW67_25750 [Shigella boydii]
MVRRLRFSGPKTSIICTPMTSLKTSIKTITYLSDTGCLEIQGASLIKVGHLFAITFTTIKHFYVSVYIILLYH